MARFDHQRITDLKGLVDAFVESQQQSLIKLCGDLVSAVSVNPPGRIVEAAAIVQAFLASHGVTCETLSNLPDKPNLVSRMENREPGRHLLFNGHLDTIGPGEESEWTVPIYEMTRRSGRLYGIGMGNMKGGVAALALAYAFVARNPGLWRGQVTFTAVADETIFGPDGAQWLLARHPDLLADAVICGEGPGGMALAIAEKGVFWVELEARAPARQGMLAEAETSAITRLAAAISELDRLNAERATSPPGLEILTEHAGEHGLRLSVNVGTIAGGRFVSQSATRATAEIDFRIPPGLTIADIESRLDALAHRIPGLSVRQIKGWEANWTKPKESIVEAVRGAAAAVRGKRAQLVVRLPASDASRWRAQGIPAICYGPQPELASGVDDYAYEQDVVDCAKIYALSALAYLNGSTTEVPQGRDIR